MFKVSIEKLLENTGGQYKLLELAFRRTHQLNNGMPPTVKGSSKKTATIALQEIAEEKVRLVDNVQEESETTE